MRIRKTRFIVMAAILLAGSFLFAREMNTTDQVVRVQNMPEYIASRSYIFVYSNKALTKAVVRTRSENLARHYEGTIRHTFDKALRGFSAKMTAQAALKLYEENPDIAYYEPNGVCYAIGKPSWAGGGGGGALSHTRQQQQQQLQLQATPRAARARGGRDGGTAVEGPSVLLGAKMITDAQLGVFANALGISVFLMIILYPHIVARPKPPE